MPHARSVEAGFTAMLEKPINLDRLGAALRRWTTQSAAEVPAIPPPGPDAPDHEADVSTPFLQEMVAVVGLDRARACSAEFIADATARCLRFGELLPGWEADAIVRNCREIGSLAETCGAIALSELLEEIADAVIRDDRVDAEALIGRLDAAVARLPAAMAAALDAVARRSYGGPNRWAA